MFRILAAGALAFVCLFAPAAAQTHYDKAGAVVQGAAPVPNAGSGAYVSATIGVSDAILLSAGAGAYFLDVANLSATATICISFGSTATISGSQCAAGEIALPPLWHRSWEGTFVPTDAVHEISNGAATPMSVGVK